MQKGQIGILILAGIVLVIALLGGAYYLGRQTNLQPLPKACTMEAKICPDGSSVGRVGPNCEFAECPKLSSTPEDVVETFYNTWLNCEKEFDKYALQLGPIPPAVSEQREACIIKAMNDFTIIQKEHPTDNKMWCAQDFPSRVEVDKALISNQTATVISHHFFEYSGDNQIKVTLILNGNNWKISDTACLNKEL